jgi:hypothetical protein
VTWSPAGRGQRGSALAELLVATLLLMVALAIANGLLVECLRIFASSSRDLRQPDRTLALRQLRLDLAAAEPVAFDPYWSGEDLTFRAADGWRRWRLAGDRLVRESFDADGRPAGARPMLDGLVAFRWRAPARGLVEVEILRRVPRGDSALRAGTSAWRAVDVRLEQASVVVASRTARRR